MKKYGNIVMLALAVLLVYGWVQWATTAASTVSGYSDNYRLAGEKREAGLYQLAIRYYQQALNEKSDKACIDALAQTCLEYNASESNYSVQMDCEDILNGLTGSYPQNAFPYEALAQIFMENEDYDALKTIYTKADTNDAVSEGLLQMRQSIVYRYKSGFSNYADYRMPNSGYYAMTDGTHWGLVSTDGEAVVNIAADMVGSVGEGGYYVVSQGGKSGIMNVDGVRYANLQATPEDAQAPAGGLVAIKCGGTYSYYDMDGVERCGRFEEAGGFYNGLAAVKKDGAWTVIDTEGNVKTDAKFEAFAFTNSGLFNAASVIVAKKDGQYHLYDENLAQTGDFACDEVDILTGDGFAFAQNGKWGFADYTGAVLIEPQYEEAKSFSSGRATVKQGGVWYFIDGAGNRLGDGEFESGGYLVGDSCMIKEKDHAGYGIIRFVG